MTDTTWSVHFDFTKSDGGWTYYVEITAGRQAQYNPGTGWVYYSTYPGRITIQYLFAVTTTITEVVVQRTALLNDPTQRQQAISQYNSTGGLLIDYLAINDPPLLTTYTITETLSGLAVDVRNGSTATPGAVVGLTLYGTGINPFLDHYCTACGITYAGVDEPEG